MTNKKEEQPKVEIDAKNPSMLLIDGKQFVVNKITTKKIDGVTHTDKYVYALLDDKAQFIKDKETVVKAIGTKVSAKDLIQELLKDVIPKTMAKLAKRVRDGKPIRRHYGCMGIKIGDAYIQLID